MKTPNRIRSSGIILAFVVSAAAALCAFAAEPGSQAGSRAQGSRPVREEPFQKRPFHPLEEERWIGMAIAYGPHRDGQSPGGASPTRAELREDLLLMSKHWKMLRVYGAAGPAETILDVIREEGIDMSVMHAHPLWNGLQLEDALVWTKGVVAEVQSVHPDHLIVLGETGWATKRHTVGEQATLMKGQLGEDQQKSFYDAVNAWTEGERFPVFFFEAFDENWKGGEHPDEVEKHWGLYRADRTPKKAMAVER
jgi:exo-beta-1,3-glucanase (GH17 family)